MVVDDNGDIFVFDSTRNVIEHIDNEGKNQESIVVDTTGKSLYGLRIIDDDVVLITEDRKKMETTVLSKRLQNKTMLTHPSKNSTTQYRISPSERCFRTFLNRPERQAGVFIWDKCGELINRFNFPIKDVLSVDFLREDKSGNSYFQFETRDPNATDKVRDILLSVYYLDSKGHFNTAVENIPNDYFVWLGKMLQVDDMGNIYQVLPTQDNVEINVWERQVNNLN